jgi:hypothetical protein
MLARTGVVDLGTLAELLFVKLPELILRPKCISFASKSWC